ncbi:sodium/potassium/calcium exchanger 4-like isoform X1 [Stegodyphus dumicola]|uniref:sodium/potassium/calcium exchanger 4-like isoform X1 n=1 Tax=Stegodyphus dumicola TaxID=202533 RepID=UPI0015ADDED2|nr:sodium/potassium/calcium exchanger 4-like isoform X1 [Stegodyphus dumicola]
MKMKTARRTFSHKKWRFLCILPCFSIISSAFIIIKDTYSETKDSIYQGKTSRSLLQFSNDSLIKCIPSGIDSFPDDFMTQEQRLKGGVIIHCIILLYTCAMIAVVCDDFFIPSLEIISDHLKLPSDIAGATFMAIGTSAPELFSSITGSFITEGDIGIGTIIGSAVFNMLAVTGLVGLVLWNEVLDIDWYPIARDCMAYFVTVLTLIFIISDNIVAWWESLVLLAVFFIYIAVLSYNRKVENCSRQLVKYISQKRCFCCYCEEEERTPLLRQSPSAPEIVQTSSQIRQERDSFSVEFTESSKKDFLQKQLIAIKIEKVILGEEDVTDGTLCSSPNGGFWSLAWWFLMYPANLLFFLTIPNCSFNKLYPITFLMSVLWISVLSYLAVWMVTIIGYTFSVPDSVSGLTILAAGTSVPEVISSIIVARGGLGNMAISNLVGSNTFDISFCLGAPWLVKTLISENKFLLVYSSALTYTTATLLISLVAFVAAFHLSGWKINRIVGLICLLIYAIFVVLACMYELNVFGRINKPTCN